MTLPVVRQENPSQIGMSLKNDSQQVKGLPLMPVCRAPDIGNGRHAWTFFIQKNLKSQPVILCRGKQVVVDFKSGLFFNAPIDAAKVRQKIEPTFRCSFQVSAHGLDLLAWDNRRYFAQGLPNFRDPIRVFTL